MAKVYLIRHAESVANSKATYQGQSYDTDLSSLGRKQANALVGVLKSEGIKRIVSSPLKRSMQTAIPLSEALNIEIETDKLLLETNHGDWEGRSVKEIMKMYPEEWEAWQKTPSDVQMPKGEHTSETKKRALDYLGKVRKMKVNTAVVTHGNTAQFMVCAIDNISFDSDIKIDSAGYYVIDNDSGLKLMERNANRHLKGIRSDVAKQAW